MKENRSRLPERKLLQAVQILTKSQLVNMGIENDIPEGETRAVVLGYNDNGSVDHAIVMKMVDTKRFLHGEDRYWNNILWLGEELLKLKMKLE